MARFQKLPINSCQCGYGIWLAVGKKNREFVIPTTDMTTFRTVRENYSGAGRRLRQVPCTLGSFDKTYECHGQTELL